jgi:NAD(P)-dependent dehydrogenase (short-subunit alcohol dehydrogenase family)
MTAAENLSALFGLDGKAALITGGTSGIGNMIARGLADCGVKTYITGRKQESVRKAANDIAPDCTPFVADLADFAGIKALADQIRGEQRSLDILVNNAGAQWNQPIDEFSEDGWDSVVDLNLKSVFFVTQSMLPLLRQSGSRENPSRVINIGSIGGLHVSSIENYSYSAAKGGLHHLTRALAKRLASDNITVNAIAPGPFPSRMMDTMDDSFRARIAAQTPLGRMGTESDIAGTVIYLAARAGAYVTGTVIPVDGGIIGSL